MLVGIIGAGPLGLHMACTLARKNIPYLVLEKGQPGQTIFNWPAHTRFHSASDRIAIGGLPIQSPHHQQLPRDEYLSYLKQVVKLQQLDLRPFEEVIGVEKQGENFHVQTRNLHRETNSYAFTHLVFATGTCHEPVLPSLPGIEQPQVKDTRFPLHYSFNRDLLVIGGRHSALEYATRAYHAGARKVSICARSDPFKAEHLKKELLDEVRRLVDGKKINLYTNSQVKIIHKNSAVLQHCDTLEETEVPAHWVIAACGYSTCYKLFGQLGISLSPLNQAPVFDEQTMETNVEGSYVIGTAIAGNQRSQYHYFIENTLSHVSRAAAHISVSSRVPG
jgi:thioredoxin reductase (NADPH)